MLQEAVSSWFPEKHPTVLPALYQYPEKNIIWSRNLFITWFIIGIKHGFSCINIRQVPPEAVVFNTSQGIWRMLTHWKTMFNRYYCIKTENFCYISCYFLHYFVLPFHRCLANTISTDYARSRAGQYTSRNGSKSVAPIRSYWKLRSRALTAGELPCLYTAFRWLMHGC